MKQSLSALKLPLLLLLLALTNAAGTSEGYSIFDDPECEDCIEEIATGIDLSPFFVELFERSREDATATFTGKRPAQWSLSYPGSDYVEQIVPPSGDAGTSKDLKIRVFAKDHFFETQFHLHRDASFADTKITVTGRPVDPEDQKTFTQNSRTLSLQPKLPKHNLPRMLGHYPNDLVTIKLQVDDSPNKVWTLGDVKCGSISVVRSGILSDFSPCKVEAVTPVQGVSNQWNISARIVADFWQKFGATSFREPFDVIIAFNLTNEGRVKNEWGFLAKVLYRTPPV